MKTKVLVVQKAIDGKSIQPLFEQRQDLGLKADNPLFAEYLNSWPYPKCEAVNEFIDVTIDEDVLGFLEVISDRLTSWGVKAVVDAGANPENIFNYLMTIGRPSLAEEIFLKCNTSLVDYIKKYFEHSETSKLNGIFLKTCSDSREFAEVIDYLKASDHPGEIFLAMHGKEYFKKLVGISEVDFIKLHINVQLVSKWAIYELPRYPAEIQALVLEAAAPIPKQSLSLTREQIKALVEEIGAERLLNAIATPETGNLKLFTPEILEITTERDLYDRLFPDKNLIGSSAKELLKVVSEPLAEEIIQLLINQSSRHLALILEAHPKYKTRVLDAISTQDIEGSIFTQLRSLLSRNIISLDDLTNHNLAGCMLELGVKAIPDIDTEKNLADLVSRRQLRTINTLIHRGHIERATMDVARLLVQSEYASTITQFPEIFPDKIYEAAFIESALEAGFAGFIELYVSSKEKIYWLDQAIAKIGPDQIPMAYTACRIIASDEQYPLWITKLGVNKRGGPGIDQLKASMSKLMRRVINLDYQNTEALEKPFTQ